MSLEEKLSRVLAHYADLERQVAAHPDPASQDYVRAMREWADLAPVVRQIEALQEARGELAELSELLDESEQDAEMRALAEDELAEVKQRVADLEHKVRLLLVPKDEADERNVIVEVRAGTGGDEAGLFAAELYRMYQRYAEIHGWRFEPITASETGIGAYKEASAAISGKGVFARLKFESGVHRVQRVPVTESGGRIHTSTATVAVLPEPEEVEVEIEEKDLRVDTYRSQGAGGQHVNTTDSAVRITHVPSGIVVTCQDEKSQHKNRAKALKVLRARLYDAKRQEQEDARAQSRRVQVGTGERSERIRTYNFPQGRVTDHRIGLTLHKLDRVLAGEALDELIEALTAEDEAARLAEAH